MRWSHGWDWLYRRREIQSIYAVVISAFTLLFASPNIPLGPVQISLLLTLGLLYVLWSYVFLIWEQNNIGDSVVHYLPGLAIFVAIGYFSKFSGGFWLLLVPITATGALNLPVRSLVVLCVASALALVLPIWQVTGTFDAVWQASMTVLPAIVFTAIFTKLTHKERDARAAVESLNQQLTAVNQQLGDYATQAEELATSAVRVEAGVYEPEHLDNVAQRVDGLGQLARLFQHMERTIHAREQSLIRQVEELRIEIDEVQQSREVERIVDADFFEDLRAQGTAMRKLLDASE